MAAIVLTKAQRELIIRLGIYVILLIIASVFTIYLSGSVEEYE